MSRISSTTVFRIVQINDRDAGTRDGNITGHADHRRSAKIMRRPCVRLLENLDLRDGLPLEACNHDAVAELHQLGQARKCRLRLISGFVGRGQRWPNEAGTSLPPALRCSKQSFPARPVSKLPWRWLQGRHPEATPDGNEDDAHQHRRLPHVDSSGKPYPPPHGHRPPPQHSHFAGLPGLCL